MAFLRIIKFVFLSYTSCKSVKLYKSRAEDEGTRAVCNYMDKVKKVEVLDLLSNDITPLGLCFFINCSNTMHNVY